MTTLQEVYNEWQNNPSFREAFNKNPKDALNAAGFSLSESDLAKVLKMRKMDNNQQLDERINK